MTLDYCGTITEIIMQSNLIFLRKNGMTIMILHKDLELFTVNENELGH